jgi:hypothetical protein
VCASTGTCVCGSLCVCVCVGVSVQHRCYDICAVSDIRAVTYESTYIHYVPLLLN